MHSIAQVQQQIVIAAPHLQQGHVQISFYQNLTLDAAKNKVIEAHNGKIA
jgi:hypothetical protein